jgi:hypothetical protein
MIPSRRWSAGSITSCHLQGDCIAVGTEASSSSALLFLFAVCALWYFLNTVRYEILVLSILVLVCIVFFDQYETSGQPFLAEITFIPLSILCVCWSMGIIWYALSMLHPNLL